MLLPDVEQFRATLTLVDRFSDAPVSEALRQRHQHHLRELAACGCAHLGRVADSMVAGETCAEMDEAWACYESFSEEAAQSLQDIEVEAEDKENLMSLKRAYYAVFSNMGELTRQLNHCIEEGAPVG